MNRETMLSVIVPVYNVEAYLPRCVDSILAQTYSNLEVILVDDGAKDKSGAICDDYAARDSRVKVIHKENGGLSSARNAGLDVAKGDYIAFVDSDDWVKEEAYDAIMNKLRELVKSGQMIDMFISNFVYEKEGGNNYLRVVLDSETIIDMERVVAATKIINPLLDKEEIVKDNNYILDIYAKSKGDE